MNIRRNGYPVECVVVEQETNQTGKVSRNVVRMCRATRRLALFFARRFCARVGVSTLACLWCDKVHILTANGGEKGKNRYTDIILDVVIEAYNT